MGPNMPETAAMEQMPKPEADQKQTDGLKTLIKSAKEKWRGPAAFLSAGKVGAWVFLLLLILSCAGGLVHSYVPFVSKWVLYPIVLLFLPVSALILFVMLRLCFGTPSLSRTLYLQGLILAIFVPLLASQGTHIWFAAVFGFLLVSALDLLGRCLFARIIKKKRSAAVFVFVPLSLLVIAGAAVIVLPSGFAHGNLAVYTALYPEAAPAPSGFETSVGAGSHAVHTLVYGVGEGFDLLSEPYDLSPFAQRAGIGKLGQDLYFDTDLDETPLAGKIWYPADAKDRPVLFMVHGNHQYAVSSYLGYDYIGEHLAAWGYVVVSVDESHCNGLSSENDARAILLLENVRLLLKWNGDSSSPLFRVIDPEKIALAGQSRGGEAVGIAALFNQYRHYPENGNIAFDYGFDIKSLIAVAPTVDQYMPADRAVALTDVNYLLIHGSNDQDVSHVMGEKQYNNVRFSENSDCFKSALYILGANHGQFNSQWGRYDLSEPLNRFLDVKDFISEKDQQTILCTVLKTYLDVTLNGDGAYRSLFYNVERYRAALPETVYAQMYQGPGFVSFFDFDREAGLEAAFGKDARLTVTGCSVWTETGRKMGSSDAGENHSLSIQWGVEKEDDPREVDASIEIALPETDLSGCTFSFSAADMREGAPVNEPAFLAYRVVLTDADGKTAETAARSIVPAMAVQLYKVDSIFGLYEYKHPFTTALINSSDAMGEDGFDISRVKSISIVFAGTAGAVQIDDIGFYEGAV